MASPEAAAGGAGPTHPRDRGQSGLRIPFPGETGGFLPASCFAHGCLLKGEGEAGRGEGWALPTLGLCQLSLPALGIPRFWLPLPERRRAVFTKFSEVCSPRGSGSGGCTAELPGGCLSQDSGPGHLPPAEPKVREVPGPLCPAGDAGRSPQLRPNCREMPIIKTWGAVRLPGWVNHGSERRESCGRDVSWLKGEPPELTARCF